MTETVSTILRQYYKEKDFVSSTDGILKVLSVIGCIVVGVLALSTQHQCGRAPPLAGSAGGAALVSAAALALLTAAALLAAPSRAPLLWLYTDIISSSVIGVQLVVAAILSLIFCQRDSVLLYIYFALGLITVSMTTGSAVGGYRAAMRRVDAARPPHEPRRASPAELDV